jgi:hypothetical protein
MLYTAYLVICMVLPITGGEHCTLAAKPLIFPTEKQCMFYIDQERDYLKGGANLEGYRAYLPSIAGGKLKLKWRCASPVQDEWLGRELKDYRLEIE